MSARLLKDFSAEQQQVMIRRTDEELACRSRSAAFSHFALASIVYLSTPYRVDHPRLILALLAATLVLGAGRLAMTVSFRPFYARNPVLCRRIFFHSTLASPLTWGAFTGLTVILYGFDKTTYLQIVLAVGLAACAVVPFSPSLPLYGWFAGLMLMPTVVCALVIGGRDGYAIASILIFGLAFLFVQGRHLSVEYWKALGNSLLLEMRAGELEVARNHAESVNRMLQTKNAELDSFVHSVSHDLKAPLVAVEGMAGMLAEDFGARLDDEGRHYLSRLQASVRQMKCLIQDLLAIARIGRESRAPEAVPLDALVEDFQAEASAAIQARGIKIVVHDTGVLWGVRSEIEQVMRNLLGNAVKYMGEGQAPMIEVGMRQGESFVECYVKDNGIGIDPRYHARVFEIFQRLKEIEAEGTGVGLAIVKKIVEGVGGRIWIESQVGQGATFRFTWPVRSADTRRSHPAD